MKISIVGANSYIARNLTYYIKNTYNDFSLYLYDFNDTHKDNEDNYTKIDFDNITSLNDIQYDSDIIYFFTGMTGTIKGFNEFDKYIDINEKYLLRFLNCYVNHKSQAKIIFPSTRLVYKGRPGLLKEESLKEFKTIYAMNKYACENYLKMYHNLYGINYVIFRICVPYGTLIENASSYGTAEFMLNKARNKENITLFGKGEVRRTLINIEDLCRALLNGATNFNCINDIYNIGGENYSLYEMAKEIAKKYNIDVEFTKWPKEAELIESGDTVFDSEKFDKLNNFEYKHKFIEWISND